jgi:CarboxypepD_reg-like domain
VERVAIQGEIIVPKGDEREGINIYNVSSQKGTVTDAEGKFSLEVAANDRVLITAIQFQSFTVIVDEGVVGKKMMRVFMNPAINQLDEVVVSPYDLSGNINVDVKRMKVYNSPNYDLSYETLNYDYEFTQDRQSSIEGNAAEDALNSEGMQNGLNFISIFGVLAKAIFPAKERKNSTQSLNNGQVIFTALQQRYSQQYYAETFGIPIEKVDDYIYFASENAITPHLLKSKNEIELLQVLFEQSILYKARLKDEN